MLSLSTFSELSGYTSIGCWLGAQFPQVVENIQRQSCEGLALPFLANWFLGDLSNLIGCILTDQLPFQTYLATYFVFVDLTLVCQYFYYQNWKPPPPSVIRARERAASLMRRRSSEIPRYRTLSAVAANVATAAALAVQQEEAHTGRQRRSSTDWTRRRSASRFSESADLHGDDEADERTFATMANSFHSEGGRNTRIKTHVSWNTERRGASVGRVPVISRGATLPPVPFPRPESSETYTGSSHRGRTLRRSVDLDLVAELESQNQSQRRSSRASRRGVGIVFLGVWALFGFGTLVGTSRGITPTTEASVGRLVSFGEMRIPAVEVLAHPTDPSQTGSGTRDIYFAQANERPSHDDESELTSKRVLGRIFAWLCTTLYLTSRLPQIWKNFVRKSVEGLSMYLFVFAFLGNCFYVVSIMTSPQVRQPPPISTTFLKESLPYLLGSAGTLMFDVTIVSQSFIYRPRHRRHASLRNRALVEEEAALLNADALANSYHASSEFMVQSRGRASTTS